MTERSPFEQHYVQFRVEKKRKEDIPHYIYMVTVLSGFLDLRNLKYSQPTVGHLHGEKCHYTAQANQGIYLRLSNQTVGHLHFELCQSGKPEKTVTMQIQCLAGTRIDRRNKLGRWVEVDGKIEFAESTLTLRTRKKSK